MIAIPDPRIIRSRRAVAAIAAVIACALFTLAMILGSPHALHQIRTVHGTPWSAAVTTTTELPGT